VIFFSAEVKLVYLSQEQQFLEEICQQRSLKFTFIKSRKSGDIYSIETIKSFGLTETEIVSDLHTGIKEILDLENRFKPAEPEEKPDQMKTALLKDILKAQAK